LLTYRNIKLICSYIFNLNIKSQVGSLPKILKHIRTFNKLTQLELSEKLNISRSYISQIEKGIKNPTNETLQKYSEVFDIPLSVIYLFAENLDNKGFKNKAKKLLTKSSLNLLDWISK
jgi:transcriptional regulator with XRE-family HTH domain